MKTEDNKYQQIIDHYEACFAKFGDTPEGIDWPNLPDLLKRYKVMLDVIRPQETQVSLLDFGCGTAGLNSFIVAEGLSDHIRYSGLDMGKEFIEHCRKKFPDIEFHWADVVKNPELMPVSDYVVMNGVFTEKCGMSFDEMWNYSRELLKIVYKSARKGIAFNVMSSHVDWEREDLFHLPVDELLKFSCAELSRNVVIRNDYGLYEYTAYVYREPVGGIHDLNE